MKLALIPPPLCSLRSASHLSSSSLSVPNGGELNLYSYYGDSDVASRYSALSLLACTRFIIYSSVWLQRRVLDVENVRRGFLDWMGRVEVDG